jgi:nitric oxide reductase subunit C
MGLRIALMSIALLAGCQMIGLGRGDAELRAEGRKLWTTRGCIGCHTRGVEGTPIAPDLMAINRKYSVDSLARWLRNPAAQVPQAHMPTLDLTEREIDALVLYLTATP